jgi:hypothetical protein
LMNIPFIVFNSNVLPKIYVLVWQQRSLKYQVWKRTKNTRKK